MISPLRTPTSVGLALVLAAATADPCAAQGLPSGGSVTGSLVTTTDVDTWTFQADVGESFLVRASDASNSVQPYLSVTAPSGASVGASGGYEVTQIGGTAAEAGTYTVAIQEWGNDATGVYAIDFIHAPSANELGSLPSQGSVTSTLDLGDLDSFTLQLQAGDRYELRVADTDVAGLYPRMRVYGPDGGLLASPSGGTALYHYGLATVTGTYTIVVSDYSSGYDAVGNYTLHVARLPQADEHGALIDGGSRTGQITLGDIDSYTLELAAGENYQLRIVDSAVTGLYPIARLYDPYGGLVQSQSSGTVVSVDGVAPYTGEYTLTVADWSSGVNATGAYEVHYTRLPSANEHGTLVSGTVVSETIDLGDLDTWELELAAGQTYQLRVCDHAVTGLYPLMRLYGPQGQLLESSSSGTVTALSGTAPANGTYTVAISDYSSGLDASGGYDLHYVAMPNAVEHGELVDGGSVNETIELGDVDSYSVQLGAGETYELRIADVNVTGFYPIMHLYAPYGGLVATSSGGNVARITGTAGLEGTYTVVVTDYSSGLDAAGDYELHFASLPGANEHGELPLDGSVAETLTLGDIDTWSMELEGGETYRLRVTDVNVGGLYPIVRVVDPNGVVVGSTSGGTVAEIAGTASFAGTYSVVVGDWSSGLDAIGAYRLHVARMPGADELGCLVDGELVAEQIELGDLDSYTFLAQGGDVASIRVTDTAASSLYPIVFVYGPYGQLLASKSGSTTVDLALTLTIDGFHTIVVGDWSSGIDATGDYEIVVTGSGSVPPLPLNVDLPAQFPTDPALTDVGGDPAAGPRIGDPTEPFNFALDCSNATEPSVWLMEAHLVELPLPLPSPYGPLYLGGGKLLGTAGVHAQAPVTFAPLGVGVPIADQPSLIGLTFTVQGFVGGIGPAGRLSNAIRQTIGC